MRLALFTWESLHSVLMGGLGVHVTELAAGLERRGHELHVITCRREGQRHYDRIDGVHYHRIDHGRSENWVESMDFMCKAMAHRFHEITTLIGRFDLVHAHDWLTANALAYVRDGYGTRGVLTLHSTEYGRAGNVCHEGLARWIRDTEAAGCHNAHTLIAVSRFLAAELEWLYGVPAGRIQVVPNGVAYHEFDGFINPAVIKRRYGIAPLAPTVLAAGRMTRQKGMDLLVAAVPMVLASYPDAHFIIAGSGPDKDQVVGKAQALGVTGAIVFLDMLARGAYVDLIRAADIVVLPSRNEPFGIVALEAWAAGKPVVATTAGGPAEFIWHDVNGFLVDATPNGLAHGIGSLLADHDHCRALGANGRRAVEATYQWNQVAAATERVYQAALAA